VTLRRQRLTDKQVTEAATLYQAGRSLAWIGDHFGDISPTTVARVPEAATDFASPASGCFVTVALDLRKSSI
jgi:hypothetical protein